MGKPKKKKVFYDVDGTLVKSKTAYLTNSISPTNPNVMRKFKKDKADKNVEVGILTCRLPFAKKTLEKNFKVKTKTWNKKRIPSSSSCADYKTKVLNKEAKKGIKIEHFDDLYPKFDKNKLKKNVTIIDPNTNKRKKGTL